jgi:hypothetical protein
MIETLKHIGKTKNMPPKQLDHEEKVNPIEPDYLLAVSHIGF